MKKLLCALLSFSLFFSPAVQAADLSGFDNIDAIMEDNALTDVANRYGAVQLSFFPEYATRIGFESADGRLDQRDAERDAQALRAYGIVEESLDEINRKELSEAKKTDYDVLKGRLAVDQWNLRRNRTVQDPLLYSQVFDAVYDLTMKTLNFQDLQDRDMAARLRALPDTAAEAENNLSEPPAFLAQLAMEDAYYAYLAFDTVPNYLNSRAQDDVSRAQLRAEAKASKEAVRSMFELFKQLAQDTENQEFRLGEEDFTFLLENYYFIDEKPRKLEKHLTQNFRAAQENLAQALEMFALPVAVQEAETVVEQMQVPGEEAQEGVTVSQLESGEVPAAEETAEAAAAPQEAKNKKKDKNAPLVLASDFYALSARLAKNVKEQDFAPALEREAASLAKFFAQDDTLPTSDVEFSIYKMPDYYAYTRAYMFLPPFGTQTNPTNDLFLRLPSGNELTKQEMLDRDFNGPTLKLLLAGQLVPGLYYRSAYNGNNLSSFRKMYPVPTLRNGWEVYAQHLASERGYIITDEELLYLAWADYVRAAAALVDFRLHMKQYTYADAYNFLTQENGFDKTQAETLLKQMARQPGEAVSYVYGYDAIKALREKYQKKEGKNFSLASFHSKLLNIGDIPPQRLEAEMEYAYELEKSHLTQALSMPFYLN